MMRIDIREARPVCGWILVTLVGIIALSCSGCCEDESDKGIAECSVALVTPNNGGLWTVGDSLEVAWTTGEHCGAYARIDLLQNGDSCRTVADSVAAQTYDWIVTPCEGDSGYAIRVTDLVTGEFDVSDSPFAIAQLALITPNGGEWLIGEAMTIAWEAGAACGDSVRIDLLRDGAVCRTLSEGVTGESYDWTVNRCEDTEIGYAIRITDLLSGAADASDTSFAIRSIDVTAPNGGDYLVPASRAMLTWRASAECGPSVKLELIRNGTVCRTIATGVPNTGSYDWTVTACGTAQSGYLLRVTDEAGAGADESDAPFSITTIIPLSYAISRAAPGEANGHSFARLVDLDPYLSYSGGVRIKSDTCIRGHGARIDLGGRNIDIMPDGDVATRFDIDHCVITYGNVQAAYGGALEYWASCSGWIFNNTFFKNQTSGIYLHENFLSGDTRIFHNVFYNDGVCGVVRPNDVSTEGIIRYNCSNAHSGEMNFCEHCGCAHDPTPKRIDASAAGPGNFESDPEFISTDPKSLNLHLRPGSPCIASGENGEDLGAYPYEPD